MRPRKHHLLLAAALVGVVAIVPAVASSEAGPTVSGLESIMWSPTQVTVAAGATVSFQNSSGSVPHGVVWETGNPETPACSGVPIDEGQTNWKGSCTFTKSGVYQYYCSVHGMAMSGTIIVGTPPTTPTPPPTTPTTPAAPTPPPAPTEVAPTGARLTSPLTGSAAKAIALAVNQHGQSVRGSIQVSPAGAGARLEIDLLAVGAAPTASRRAAAVRVGGLMRTSLKAGRVSFAAPLDRQGRAALHRRGRLVLAVRITLTPTHGAAVHVTRTVIMHASDQHA
ncbi:MAG TPA: plastocyanin/azurin family copper-binding protein [Solirubrobacteraceae bacterium]|jgi:plastocyanin